MIIEATQGRMKCEVDGKRVTVSVEHYARGFGNPDYIAYKKLLRKWDDGVIIGADEIAQIMSTLEKDCKDRGWSIQWE